MAEEVTVKKLNKKNMLPICLACITSPYLESMIEEIIPVLYFDGTEDELDSLIESGRMIKFYSEEDIEVNGESKWKIRGSVISSYVIDRVEEEEKKIKDIIKDDNVLHCDFKKK